MTEILWVFWGFHLVSVSRSGSAHSCLCWKRKGEIFAWNLLHH